MQIKKTLLILILILFPFLNHAQTETGYVKYKFQVKKSPFSDTNIKINTILDFNNHESFYISNKLNMDSIANLGNARFNETDLIIETATHDEKGYIIYRNFLNKELIFNSKKIMTIPAYQIKDNWIEMKWKIIEEFKEIAGYKSQKATTTFRGVDYEVWFTRDIPLPYGPIKLFGLPGVILEVWYKNQKQIAAYEVCYPCPNINLIEVPTEKESLPIKEYVHLLDNLDYYLAIEFNKNSKNGGILTNKAMPTEKKIWERRQLGYEKLYEWENEKTKRLVSEKELRKVVKPKKKEEKTKSTNDLYFRPEPISPMKF